MPSAPGVGGLVGAVAVTWVSRLLGARWAMFADLIGTTAVVAPPALTTGVRAVAVGSFLGGMGGTLRTVNARTITQHEVPDEMLGRYGAAARLFTFGAMPLGAAPVGLSAELGGMRPAFAVFAVATAATPVLFLKNLTPVVRDTVRDGTRKAIQGLYDAEDKEHAAGTVRKITADEDELPAFHDFPAEHRTRLIPRPGRSGRAVVPRDVRVPDRDVAWLPGGQRLAPDSARSRCLWW